MPGGAGWYPDPQDQVKEWYWDGSGYTASRQRSHHAPIPPPPQIARDGVAPAAPREYSATTVAIPIKVFGHAAKLKELDVVLQQWANDGWTLDKVVELQTKDGALQVRDRVMLLLVFVRG